MTAPIWLQIFLGVITLTREALIILKKHSDNKYEYARRKRAFKNALQKAKKGDTNELQELFADIYDERNSNHKL